MEAVIGQIYLYLAFNSVKIITTGEGGCITTNNKEYFEYMKMFRENGVQKIQKNLNSNLPVPGTMNNKLLDIILE